MKNFKLLPWEFATIILVYIISMLLIFCNPFKWNTTQYDIDVVLKEYQDHVDKSGGVSVGDSIPSIGGIDSFPESLSQYHTDNYITNRVIPIVVVDDISFETDVETDFDSVNETLVEQVDSVPIHGVENVDAIPNVVSLDIQYTDDFLSLCSVIHHEAGVAAPLDSKVIVGRVVVNRLNDPKWGYSTLNDVIYAESQFNVVNKASFENLKSVILAGNWSDDVATTVNAATIVLSDSEYCSIPSDVQFFYGDPQKRTWGRHTYCFTYGGNSYFK